MRGHYESSTRKLNRHYQVGSNGIIPVPQYYKGSSYFVGGERVNLYFGYDSTIPTHQKIYDRINIDGQLVNHIRWCGEWAVSVNVLNADMVNSSDELINVSLYKESESKNIGGIMRICGDTYYINGYNGGTEEEFNNIINQCNPIYLEDIQPATYSSTENIGDESLFNTYEPFSEVQFSESNEISDTEHRYRYGIIARDNNGICMINYPGETSYGDVNSLYFYMYYPELRPSEGGIWTYNLDGTETITPTKKTTIQTENLPILLHFEKGKKYGYQVLYKDIKYWPKNSVGSEFSISAITCSMFCGKQDIPAIW